jgi:spermidine synthase
MATWPVLFVLLYDAIILANAFRGRGALQRGPFLLTILFFFSGMPALIYQIVWQRALFAIYGVNSESVVVVVSAFMIGLGAGSLLGGWLSERFPRRTILLFALAEFSTALFGLASLSIFHWISLRTAGAPLTAVVPLSLALLVVPTVCMGATLPLLAEHLVGTLCPVGYSAGVLYFANTFGSAVACFLCASFLLRDLGQQGAVRTAALLNLAVGIAAVLLWHWQKREPATFAKEKECAVPFLSVRSAMVLSALTGFVSLGFEIVWFRVFVLASNDRAPAFALLLSTFLGGIAAGAYIAGKLSERRAPPAIALAMAVLLMAAGGFSPYLLPGVAFLKWKNVDYLLAAFAFFLIAALVGAIFPLLCKLSLRSDEKAGRGVSLIYVSNIAGSASGSLLIGFILLNYFGLRTMASLLALAALLLGFGLLVSLYRSIGLSLRKTALLGLAFLAAFALAQPLHSGFYERLSFGSKAADLPPIMHLVENRSGIITVLEDGAVFGSGVYDGYFNVDPLDDKNMIVRAYGIGAFHPAPKRVLIIGLSSGSWAQVLANHPDTESVEIVEINAGYLNLIPRYPAVRSLLRNPRVTIHIDDGRRWLLAHPAERYDFILQNTSFYWRDHSSELLSQDYLRIIREHLGPGGVYYYNTTSSDDVVATGLSVFPHGLRVLNFLAVSDSPIRVDKERWLSNLREFRIDGKLIFDATDSRSREVLKRYGQLADSLAGRPEAEGWEGEESLRDRIKDPLIITDDNMGWEWREPK